MKAWLHGLRKVKVVPHFAVYFHEIGHQSRHCYNHRINAFDVFVISKVRQTLILYVLMLIHRLRTYIILLIHIINTEKCSQKSQELIVYYTVVYFGIRT